MSKHKSLFLILVLTLTLSACSNKPRYEYHGDGYKFQVIFDNQTGKVYKKIYGGEWELEDPIKTGK